MKKNVKEIKRKLRELAWKHAPRKVKVARAAKVAAQLSELFNSCPAAYIQDQPD